MDIPEISMTIPAESRFVAIARVVAASLAAELDFTVDEIEELRVGANELVALLVEAANDGDRDRVELVFGMHDDGVEVRGRVDDLDPAAAADDDPLDFLATQILDAVVDEYEVGHASGRISKRRAAQ